MRSMLRMAAARHQERPAVPLIEGAAGLCIGEGDRDVQRRRLAGAEQVAAGVK